MSAGGRDSVPGRPSRVVIRGCAANARRDPVDPLYLFVSLPCRWLTVYADRMTFANVGTLGAAPGKRDELVAILTRRHEALAATGCLAYEVGVTADEPDTVFVVELWESAAAHQASLELPEVREAIESARPLLSGKFGGFRFDVVGSPLRD